MGHKRIEHKMVETAIYQGKLVRPSTCARCNDWCQPLAHHNDYDYPLDVIWLCPSCHGIVHRRLKGLYPQNWQPDPQKYNKVTPYDLSNRKPDTRYQRKIYRLPAGVKSVIPII